MQSLVWSPGMTIKRRERRFICVRTPGTTLERQSLVLERRERRSLMLEHRERRSLVS